MKSMAILQKYFKFMISLFLLPAIVAISIYSLDQKGFFKIDRIEITSSSLNSQKTFIQPKIIALNEKLNKFKGLSLWKFALGSVADILKQEAWVKNFQLSRSWPSGLKIEIEAEAVAFLVQTNESGQNSTYFSPITVTGEVLGKIDSSQAPNTILVRDISFVKNKKIRDGALTLIKSLPTQGKLHPSQVSEIGYDKKEGYWIQLLQSEVKINLGEEQFEIKTARVAQVIDYLENRDLKARVIDANLSKKVLVRMH